MHEYVITSLQPTHDDQEGDDRDHEEGDAEAELGDIVAEDIHCWPSWLAPPCARFPSSCPKPRSVGPPRLPNLVAARTPEHLPIERGCVPPMGMRMEVPVTSNGCRLPPPQLGRKVYRRIRYLERCGTGQRHSRKRR